MKQQTFIYAEKRKFDKYFQATKVAFFDVLGKFHIIFVMGPSICLSGQIMTSIMKLLICQGSSLAFALNKLQDHKEYIISRLLK